MNHTEKALTATIIIFSGLSIFFFGWGLGLGYVPFGLPFLKGMAWGVTFGFSSFVWTFGFIRAMYDGVEPSTRRGKAASREEGA